MMKLFSLLLWAMALFPVFLPAQNCEDGVWTTGFQRPGTLTQPRAMVYDEVRDVLYVGDPEQFGGDPTVEKVGRWDGKNWTGLGDFVCTSCGSGTIRALELGSQGDLYIGGFFEGVIDQSGIFVASKNVIKWNATTESFEALGFGVEADQVYALSYWNDSLVVGGRISAAKNLGADLPVNNIALYDETAQTWSAMGSGIESFNLAPDDNGDVLALERQWNGDLYVGGSFSKINGNTLVYSVAQWTPSSGWSALGDGVKRINDVVSPPTEVPAVVRDITVDANTDNIYVVGDLGPFNAAGSGLAKLASPNTTWTYETGLGNKPSFSGRWQTFSVYFQPYTSRIYIGGNFNSQEADPFQPVPGEHIVWLDVNTGQFHPLGEGITGALPGEAVTAISAGPDDLVYIGGNFNRVGNLSARFMASWDIQAQPGLDWDIMGKGLMDACDEVFAVEFHTQYVGGQFETLGGIDASAMAWYLFDHWIPDEVAFEAFNQSPSIRSMEFTTSLGSLYAGNFDSLKTALGAIAADGMAYTDFIGFPHALATNLGGPGNFRTVYDLTEWQGGIVAGGNFTSIDGVPVQGLGYRDASGNWSEMAAIGSGIVRDIFNDGDSMLYIAGNFRTVNGISVDGVASFDGTNWSAMGQGFGFYNQVYALGKDSLTGEIAVGGGFFNAYQTNGSSLASAGIVFWDGSQWNTRGEVNAQITNPAQYAQVVRAIEYGPDGTLYIGGEFSGVDNVPAKRVARYTQGGGWETIGEGVSGSDCSGYPVVNVLNYGNDRLMVGGQFSQAGGNQAHGIAIFDQSFASLTLMPDTFDVQCDTTIVVGQAGYTNWQWSTGDVGQTAYVTWDYFDSLAQPNGRVWVYASAEKEGCFLTDSIEVAFAGIGGSSTMDDGYFNQGDSTYFWFQPAFDTNYVDYDLWLIPFNEFVEDFVDTFAYQFPCPNAYDYSIRMQLKNGQCTSFWQQIAYSDYKQDRELIFPDEYYCQQTVLRIENGYSNPTWWTGETTAALAITDSMFQGANELWTSVMVDSTWSNWLGDTMICTYNDSFLMEKGENFFVPIEGQAYTYVEEDSFTIVFTPDFPQSDEIFDGYWDYGDGAGLQYIPPGDVDLGLPYTHQYPGPGTYTVTSIVSSELCNQPDTLVFDVLVGTTGLQAESSFRITIIPHPNAGEFVLRLPESLPGNWDLNILDLRGKRVFTHSNFQISGSEIPVRANDLVPGVYLLQLAGEDRSYQQKLLIQ